MDYLEVHITRKNAERLTYIALIIILLITSFVAFKKQKTVCDPVECDLEEETIEIKEEVKVIEKPKPVEEELKISYVDIENMRFAPKEMIIRNNSVVVFRNKEKATAHKIYEAHGLFLGPKLNPGDMFNYTFTVTGNYTIFSVTGRDKGTRMTVEVIL